MRQGDLGLQFLHLLLQLFLLLIHALSIATLPPEVLLKDLDLERREGRRERGKKGRAVLSAGADLLGLRNPGLLLGVTDIISPCLDSPCREGNGYTSSHTPNFKQQF